ncbi:MAG TPA: hypothetical protein VN688_12460 [Gemmataceae bacterium]|nr:hypothetical protein [Gemmataceae bacterium]
MGNVDFKFIECRALARPLSAFRRDWIDGLNFIVDGAERMVDASHEAARKVYAELSNASALARSKPTALTAERDKRVAELDAARSRLAILEGQPAIIRQRIAAALVRGDANAVEDHEAELPSAQLAIEAARRRVEILRSLLEEAEIAVGIEHREAVQAIFAKKRAELQTALDEAKAKLSRAVSELFPGVVAAEESLAASKPGWQPVEN